MKIVSYNIWNNDTNYDERMNLLIRQLRDEEIDLLALQEVRDSDLVNRIKEECQFEHYYWKEYSNCKEGLALLSRYPITYYWTNWDDTEEDIHHCQYMNTIIDVNNYKLGITNVHLDYESATNREIEIVKAVKKAESLAVDYSILLGDFNTYPNSSVHNYLSGCQSLNGHCTSWIDLADAFARMHRINTKVTLDFYNNPRWDNEYSLEIPGRFDWILLRNPSTRNYFKLNNFRQIGKERTNGITPSDHYGVLCNIIL